MEAQDDPEICNSRNATHVGRNPVLADTLYVVQDTTTKKCTVVKEMPTTKTTVIIKEAGLQFKSTAEAQAAIKKNQGLRD